VPAEGEWFAIALVLRGATERLSPILMTTPWSRSLPVPSPDVNLHRD